MVEEIFGAADDLPDSYSDSIRIALGAYGFVLEFGLGGVADTPQSEKPATKRVALIRMSPQHALIFSKLLERNVAKYQAEIGKINLPAKLFEELGLDPE